MYLTVIKQPCWGQPGMYSSCTSLPWYKLLLLQRALYLPGNRPGMGTFAQCWRVKQQHPLHPSTAPLPPPLPLIWPANIEDNLPEPPCFGQITALHHNSCTHSSALGLNCFWNCFGLFCTEEDDWRAHAVLCGIPQADLAMHFLYQFCFTWEYCDLESQNKISASSFTSQTLTCMCASTGDNHTSFLSSFQTRKRK